MLPVKHWPIAGAKRQIVTHPTMTSVLFSKKTCVRGVPNMINYIFSMHLQLSNGKQMFPQQETRPYIISVAFH
jgi:hypothetical protein